VKDVVQKLAFNKFLKPKKKISFNFKSLAEHKAWKEQVVREKLSQSITSKIADSVKKRPKKILIKYSP
jgi:hypothetical protein